MVDDYEREPGDPLLAGERRCAACGHGESDHVLRDVVDTVERQPYCIECDDWHEFVASSRDT